MKYIEPEMNIIIFEAKDAVVTSPPDIVGGEEF